MSTILEIKNLRVTYRSNRKTVHAVNGLDLELGESAVLGLVGETGAGKTTTALSILNLVQAYNGKIVEGSITFKGKEITALSKRELESIRGKEIAMIFQDPMTALNPLITIGEQIAETIRIHTKKLSRVDAHIQAIKILEMVGISASRAGDFPHQFSGGMKQRVVIAIALCCNPQVLLADEPTTALDVTIQAQVLEMMQKLQEKLGTSVILITHDLGIVAEFCKEVAAMYSGEIVEQGSVDTVFEKPLHPYTQGLFGALPSVNTHSKRLTPILGLLPDPTDLPTGCYFYPRCTKRLAKCECEHPKLVAVENRKVRCHLYENVKQV